MILIIINNHIYEVSEFVKHHPGEGILDEYLQNYKNKNATEEFNRFHFTNEADELLLESKEDHKNGICYVGPSFWKKKLPPYYYFFKNPMEDAPVFLLKKENVTFLVTSKSEDSLFLFYKKEGKIGTTDLLFDEEKKEWSVTLLNETRTEKNLNNLLTKIFPGPNKKLK